MQENSLLALQQKRCHDYSERLVNFEAQVCERERKLLMARFEKEELGTLRRLVSLERRHGDFLEKEVEQRKSRLWPWVSEQQAYLEVYQQLASIYSSEMRAASELTEA